MRLTDLEVASLLDALHFKDSNLGLNQTELGLLDRLTKELNDRGYAWSNANTKPFFEKVLKHMNK